MIYTIDTAYSHGVPTIENQKKFLKGDLNRNPKYQFKFTLSPMNPECYTEYTVFVRSPLTPVIEKKMAGKYVAENLLDGLLQALLNKCDELLDGNEPTLSDDTIYVLLPTEKSPCLSVYESKKGVVMLKAELNFYIG